MWSKKQDTIFRNDWNYILKTLRIKVLELNSTIEIKKKKFEFIK